MCCSGETLFIQWKSSISVFTDVIFIYSAETVKKPNWLHLILKTARLSDLRKIREFSLIVIYLYLQSHVIFNLHKNEYSEFAGKLNKLYQNLLKFFLLSIIQYVSVLQKQSHYGPPRSTLSSYILVAPAYIVHYLYLPWISLAVTGNSTISSNKN